MVVAVSAAMAAAVIDGACMMFSPSMMLCGCSLDGVDCRRSWGLMQELVLDMGMKKAQTDLCLGGVFGMILRAQSSVPGTMAP